MLLALAGTALPGDGRRHQRPGRPAPAALRVVAPAAPLRLPRRRPRAAAPALDRAGVPHLARPPPSTGGRCGVPPARGAGLAGRPAPGRKLRHGLRVTSVVPRPRASCPSTSPGARLHRLPVTAGQFLTWRFLAGPGWTRPTPIRSPRPRTAAACGSPSRRSATAAPSCACAPVPARSSRVPTGGSTERARTRPRGGVHRRRGRHHRASPTGRSPPSTCPNTHRQRQGTAKINACGAAGPHKGDALGAERGHRHGQRRDRHPEGLCPVPAECARPGGPVTARQPAPRSVEHVMGTPISLALRGRHTDDAPRVAAGPPALTELRAGGPGVQHLPPRPRDLPPGRGEIALADCPPRWAEVLALGEGRAETATLRRRVRRSTAAEFSTRPASSRAGPRNAPPRSSPRCPAPTSASPRAATSPAAPSTPPGRPGASASKTRRTRPGALFRRRSSKKQPDLVLPTRSRRPSPCAATTRLGLASAGGGACRRRPARQAGTASAPSSPRCS